MKALHAAALLFLAHAAFAQSAQTMQKQLDAEAAKVRAWGSDPAIVAAVKAQNAKHVPLATIRTLDAQWTAGRAAALIEQTTSGPCAEHLRKLATGNAAYGEIFVMDDQGALVCANTKTSDYWQGDEAKWQRAYNDGAGAVFIDRPRYDDSASRNLAQISIPVMENGHAIGAITVGVSLH
jgi:hypothetical protein